MMQQQMMTVRKVHEYFLASGLVNRTEQSRCTLLVPIWETILLQHKKTIQQLDEMLL